MRKKKDIENQIREDFKNTTPNVLKSIDFHEHIERKPRRIPWYKRKFTYATTGVFLLILLSVFVIGDPLEDSPILPNTNGPSQRLQISEKEAHYSLSAMSAVTLLDNGVLTNGTVENQSSLQQLFNAQSNPMNTRINERLDVVNGYMNMLEPIIKGEENFKFSSSPSTMDAYSIMVRFTGKDLSGETFEYTMHYNETQIDEDEYAINGIMVVGDTHYELEGEIELDDAEVELNLIAYHPNESDSYIEIHQEIEDDEQSFEFEFVRNGDTIYESTLEIAFDDDEIVVEIELETPDEEIELEFIYTYGETLDIVIEFEIASDTVDEAGIITVSIIEEDGKSYYEYTIMIEDGETYVETKRRQYGSSS